MINYLFVYLFIYPGMFDSYPVGYFKRFSTFQNILIVAIYIREKNVVQREKTTFIHAL